MALENISKEYPNNPILKNTTATIERGDKIVLIGANGKGKSTLLRIIAGTEVAKGERKLGHNVNFSFYAQHQLESLHMEETLLEELKYADASKSETELRSVLGCFLFGGEDVFKKIKVLSGGEKSRVALAKILISEANFLLLDEPTNHLDMQSVNILVQALDQYEGTYVVVSHDRHFISRVSNKVWYIEDQEIKQFPGGYDEFVIWMEDNGKTLDEPIKKAVKEPEVKVQKAAEPKPVKKENKKLEREIGDLEEKIMATEEKISLTENQLADPEVFSNPDALKKANAEYSNLKKELTVLNDTWEEKMMELEA
jgi:ATP-binding cassette subfamily F protein 3